MFRKEGCVGGAGPAKGRKAKRSPSRVHQGCGPASLVARVGLFGERSRDGEDWGMHTNEEADAVVQACGQVQVESGEMGAGCCMGARSQMGHRELA